MTKEKSAPPPLVGEHSRALLRELGCDDDAIKSFACPGVTNICRVARRCNESRIPTDAQNCRLSMKLLRLFFALLLVRCDFMPTVPAQDKSATTPDIFRQFSEHVVKIEVVETGSAAKATIGTRFYADALGRIVTNYHVVSKLIHSPERYKIEVTDTLGRWPRRRFSAWTSFTISHCCARAGRIKDF